MRLVLASASPRRADLLTAAGYVFDIQPADVNERVEEGEAPRSYVLRLAEEKSAAVLAGIARSMPGRPAGLEEVVVLAADTAVVSGGEILGKPTGPDDAVRMLKRLSGRTHHVMTGVSVRCLRAEASHVETTAVVFASLSQAEIAWYVASGEWSDKAGGYGIQGLASRFIPRIEGSYSNVVGLPVAPLDGLLRQLGWHRGILASGE